MTRKESIVMYFVLRFYFILLLFVSVENPFNLEYFNIYLKIVLEVWLHVPNLLLCIAPQEDGSLFRSQSRGWVCYLWVWGATTGKGGGMTSLPGIASYWSSTRALQKQTWCQTDMMKIYLLHPHPNKSVGQFTLYISPFPTRLPQKA